jgi:acyl carrier protein
MIFEKVAKILSDHEDLELSGITMESSFEQLGLDSLSIVELVMELEEAFDISIEMDDGLKTVGDVVRLIEQTV